MSTRIYVFKDTDKKIEEMAEVTKFTKAEIVMLAINRMYDRRKKHAK